MTNYDNLEPSGFDDEILRLPMFLTPVPQPGTPQPPSRSGSAQHLAAAINGAPVDVPAAAPSAPVHRSQVGREIDWKLVTVFRTEVSNRLTKAEREAKIELTTEQRWEAGRAFIVDVIREHVDALIRDGQADWDDQYVNRTQKAVFDSLFKLGRLQELVDDDEVENVMVFGFDQVFVDYGGGRYVQAGPVADSDEQLIETLQFMASREGERGRPFSSVHWELRLSLPGGERLQATHPPISPRPHVVIRRHPLLSITLDDLVKDGTITPAMAEFLTAAVRARKSIVVSGQQGAGKTTLVRSLAHTLDPWEHIVTIESERELHLDRSGLHKMITSFEARPSQGEVNADGSKVGEVTLGDLIITSLRHNTHRIIVGEARASDEVVAMIQAMQAGAGSMSTIHVNTANEAIERLTTLLSQSRLAASHDFGYKLIGQHIDFVVQISNHVGANRTKKRFVSEIVEVVPSGENSRPAVQPIFKAARGTDTAVVVGRPQPETLEALEEVGFDPNWLLPGTEGRAAG